MEFGAAIRHDMLTQADYLSRRERHAAAKFADPQARKEAELAAEALQRMMEMDGWKIVDTIMIGMITAKLYETDPDKITVAAIQSQAITTLRQTIDEWVKYPELFEKIEETQAKTKE